MTTAKISSPNSSSSRVRPRRPEKYFAERMKLLLSQRIIGHFQKIRGQRNISFLAAGPPEDLQDDGVSFLFGGSRGNFFDIQPVAVSVIRLGEILGLF